ncbi:MAG: hypothetical protein Kow0031_20470 [Anaerolineae bacterium]
MIRPGHVYYDLRELLGSTSFLVGLAVIAGFFVLFISMSFVYLFVLLFAAIIAGRAIIGPRCPQCDAALREQDSTRDNDDAFTLYITWRCPNCPYEEKEKVKGDSGLFGAG